MRGKGAVERVEQSGVSAASKVTAAKAVGGERKTGLMIGVGWIMNIWATLVCLLENV